MPKTPARKSRDGKAGADGHADEPLFDRRFLEQQMQAAARLLEGREFDSIEEMNAFLNEAMGGGPIEPPAPRTPLEEAQQVVYEALEAKGKRREKLARRALEISPDAADAYVLLAEMAKDAQEARGLYEQGVQAGERALGPEAFAEMAGEFWGALETRPYMRARQGLAEVLWHLNERDAAIGHAKDMLRLNPGDNQGIRYLLMNWLLASGDNAEAQRLLSQYPDEWSANWAYSGLLVAFRTSEPGKAAESALKHAIEVNQHVALYLTGVKELPKSVPGFYGMGDENEAVIYLVEGLSAWADTPGAIEWTAKTLVRIGVESLTASKKTGRRPGRK
jgi:Tetratricopeptide repeat